MAGIGKYKKGAKFTLRSGNSPEFKMVGSSPIMHYVDDVPDHNDGHSDDLQTPEEHEAAKSPVKHGKNSKCTGAHNKFKTETEHEEYHDIHPTKDLNKAEMKKASKEYEGGPSRITKPKTKEEMDAFRAAQLEDEGFDERETERINP